MTNQVVEKVLKCDIPSHLKPELESRAVGLHHLENTGDLTVSLLQRDFAHHVDKIFEAARGRPRSSRCAWLRSSSPTSREHSIRSFVRPPLASSIASQ